MSWSNDGIVIVGASAAGLSAADGLREGGYAGSITVLDEDVEPGYDRPMLSKGLLAANEHAEPASLRTAQQLADKGIELLAGHGAMGLDIDRRLVVTNWGEAIPWQQLVIASGVSARPMWTTGGAALPTLRTRSDLITARQLATRNDSAALIGGGFIGLEVAAALRSHGVDVTVLDRDEHPLAQLLGNDVASWVHDLHVGNGVSFELGIETKSIEETVEGYDLHLADGRVRRAVAVLAGIGTEPNTGWLIGSGILLNDGVVTDAAGRTSVSGVWAAGDVATGYDPRLGYHRRFEHWTYAIEQGRRIGLNIACGAGAAYGSVPYVWTEQYGHTLHLLGERRHGDTSVVVEGDLDSGDFVVAHADGNELHAVTICGRIRALRTYKKLLRSDASLTDAISVATPA